MSQVISESTQPHEHKKWYIQVEVSELTLRDRSGKKCPWGIIQTSILLFVTPVVHSTTKLAPLRASLLPPAAGGSKQRHIEKWPQRHHHHLHCQIPFLTTHLRRENCMQGRWHSDATAQRVYSKRALKRKWRTIFMHVVMFHLRCIEQCLWRRLSTLLGTFLVQLKWWLNQTHLP